MSSVAPSKAPFSNLPCHPQEIQEIVETLDHTKNGCWALLMKSGHLRKLGVKIRGDHPFQFLRTIFGSPSLKGIVRQSVWTNWFKRKEFVGWVKLKGDKIEGEGVNFGMYRAMQDRTTEIDPYVDEFAHSVGTSAAAIRPLLDQGYEKRDWFDLVEHLTFCQAVDSRGGRTDSSGAPLRR